MQCVNNENKHFSTRDRGGDQVVSILAPYSDDPSSNPADIYSFSVKFVFEKDEKNKKRLVLAYFKNIISTKRERWKRFMCIM